MKREQILRAIEHDFDTKSRRDVSSRAQCPERWLKVMHDILEMPVAAWDCPTTAAGEIGNKKGNEAMTWNQNQGYGYGMQEDYIDRMNRAKKVDADRDPFIGDGPHVLQLLEMFEYLHDEKGPTVKARFKVLQSSVHPVGSTVCKLWFLTKPGKFKDSITDSDRYADFIMKLKGVEPERNPGFQVGREIRTLIREQVAAQPERGRILHATGRNVSKDPQKPFVDVSWRPLQQLQDAAALAQARGELDSNEVYALSRQFQAVMRQIQGMGQMQQAPHAAAQPQYAPPQQQQGQWQGYQNVAPPQQGYQQPLYGQPMQNPVPQGGQPGPGYGQPPQGPQAGYGAPQQPTTPQGPGFANQLPPQQGGPQGGNRGGW